MASPKKYLVLAKIETSQFTDATPAANTNSILVKNLRVTPLKVENEDRALVRPYYGNSEQLVVSQEAQIEFDVEVAGSGTPLGTAAAYGPLLRGCAFAETLTPTTKAEYNPVSSALESLTIYAYRDGILYKLTGCQGNVSLEFAAKKLPHYKFRFVGKYVAVSDAAIPSGATYTAFKTPVASIPTWTGTVTIGGYAAKLSAFSLDMGNQVDHAIWMNNETLAINDRKPKGSLTVELVTVATKDYWAGINAGTTSALVLTHGTVSGNIVTITAPAMQLMDVAEAEYMGTMALTFNTAFMPSTGNDEVKITLT